MNNKALITILAFLGLVLFATNWWCKNKGLCGCDADMDTENVAVASENTNESGVIQFNANSLSAITGAGWETYRDSIANLIKAGKRLEITGFYASSETNNSSFANLGIARADSIKKIFLAQAQGIPSSRISLVGAINESLAGATGAFSASDFKLLDTIATLSAKGGVVISDSNNMIIYFPTGSSAKEANPEIDKFLTSLSEKLKSNGQAAVITGHTDNVGNPSKNLELSRSRAEEVKKILSEKGADATKLKAEGKGDQEPVGDNATAAGRSQNRRVQIHLN